ncbi:hypothetical protein H5410_036498, partial [Solanum commersonii]
SVIRQKDSHITNLPSLFSQPHRGARFSSPKQFSDSPTRLASLSATRFGVLEFESVFLISLDHLQIWKKHIARKKAAIEPDFPEPEDEQPLINQRDALRARSHPTTTSTPSVATPPTTNSVPAQGSSVTPARPIVHPPRLLNRLKGDG